MNLPPPQPHAPAKMYAPVGNGGLMAAQRAPEYDYSRMPMMSDESYYGIQQQARMGAYDQTGFYPASATSSGNSTMTGAGGYMVLPPAQMLAAPPMSAGQQALMPLLAAQQGLAAGFPGAQPFMVMAQPPMHPLQAYMPSPLPAQQLGAMPMGVAPSEQNICKDFLVGRCIRQQCRFLHLPPNVRPFPEDVCKDYIRGTCTRQVCRFFHGTLQDYQTMRGIQQGMYPPTLPPPSPHPENYMPTLGMQAMPQVPKPIQASIPAVNAATSSQAPMTASSTASEAVNATTPRLDSEHDAIFPARVTANEAALTANTASFSAPSLKSVSSMQVGDPLTSEAGTQTTPRLASRESLWRSTKTSAEVGTEAELPIDE